jgi:hypothetical protein
MRQAQTPHSVAVGRARSLILSDWGSVQEKGSRHLCEHKKQASGERFLRLKQGGCDTVVSQRNICMSTNLQSLKACAYFMGAAWLGPESTLFSSLLPPLHLIVSLVV